MTILAIDLGTKLGWAMFCPVRGVSAGTKVLASDINLRHAKKLRIDRRLDIRIEAFALWLEVQPIDLCVFEDVRWVSSQAQGHLYGSLRGVLWSFAARRGILTDCLDTGKLKKWTTGSGSADKQAMEQAIRFRWPELVRSEYDDNTYDALALLQWAQETYKT